jgi:3-oxoacyl-[acyl-carrier-protein] synthase-3
VTAITAVSGYVPALVPISALSAQLGLSEGELARFERWYGFSTVARAPERDEAAFVLRAAERLTPLHGREHDVRYVVRARTMLTATPYPIQPLETVQQQLGLHRSIAFNLGHHLCASGLLAVELAGRLLAEDGDHDALALILAGDLVFTPRMGMIPGSAVTSEASAAVLVAADGERDAVLSYVSRTYGQFYADLIPTGSASRELAQIYVVALAGVITAAVAQAGLDLGQVRLILPHHVNRLSWVKVARTLGYPVERIYLDNQADLGHCFAADAFLNLRSSTDGGRLRRGDHYLMAAVGLGATFAAMVLRH